MKQMVFSVLLLFVVLVTLPGCELIFQETEAKSELEKLPAITSSGEHTFGCLVNGKAFVPYSGYRVYANYGLKILQFGGTVVDPLKHDTAQWISMTLIQNGTEKIQPGTYELTSPPYRDAKCSIKGCNYFEEHITSGNVTLVRFDTINRILAGTFELTAEGNGCEKISITDGRFDISF
ncbi:MAG TPA: hypothetical protein VGD65_06240 [Chryseosolibacter sp.]